MPPPPPFFSLPEFLWNNYLLQTCYSSLVC